MTGKSKRKKELTGWHVLACLLVFFGVTVAVNIYFTVVAVRSFRGEDVPRSYRQGLEYNQTLDARETQTQMGWRVRVNVTDNDTNLLVRVENKDGVVPAGVSVIGRMRHRTDTDLDAIVDFVPRGQGIFAADVSRLTGEYTLKGLAQNSETDFAFDYDLRLKGGKL